MKSTGFKKNVILIVFLLFIASCGGVKKSSVILSPQEILVAYKNKNENVQCEAFELKGTIYFFSEKQNFRGKFYLRGNKGFPWLIEIRSSFGTVLYIIKVDKNKVNIFSTREKKLYIVKNSTEVLTYFGVKIKISPEFLVQLLTGEWKRYISNPKKIIQVSDGVKYFFSKPLLKELKLFYNQNRAFIKDSTGVEVEVFGDRKILLRDENIGVLVFKIKEKICKKRNIDLKDIDLKLPY